MTLGPGVVVVGMGGNLGGHRAILDRFAAAAAALAALGRTRVASTYVSRPVGGPPQPHYLNSAVAIDVVGRMLAPSEWIQLLHQLEKRLGRVRPAPRWSARAIDLDLLLLGNRQLHWAGPPPLTIPHPRLVHRAFALRPTIDVIGGDIVIPGTGLTLASALASVDREELVALDVFTTPAN